MHYLNYRLSLLTLLALSLATSQSFTMGDQHYSKDKERKEHHDKQQKPRIQAFTFVSDCCPREINVELVTSKFTPKGLTKRLSEKISALLKRPSLSDDFLRNTCLVGLTMLIDYEETHKSELFEPARRQSTSSSSSSPSLIPSSPSSFQSVLVNDTVTVITSRGYYNNNYYFRTPLLDPTLSNDDFTKGLVATMEESLQDPDLTTDGLMDICGQGALLATLHEKNSSSKKSSDKTDFIP